jgi:hypothetical protein
MTVMPEMVEMVAAAEELVGMAFVELAALD